LQKENSKFSSIFPVNLLAIVTENQAIQRAKYCVTSILNKPSKFSTTHFMCKRCANVVQIHIQIRKKGKPKMTPAVTEYANGHVKSEIENLTLIAPENADLLEQATSKPAKKATRQSFNSVTDVEVNIDAGARFVKATINGSFAHFPSVYRVVDEALPKNIPGCFTLDGVNYAAGKSAQFTEGELVTAANNNKIEKIHIWVLSALAHDRKLLKSLQDTKRRKSEPARIRLNIRMLSLSSALESEIKGALNQIEKFTWEGYDYLLQLGGWELQPEGYGAAIAVSSKYPELDQFHLLDMGGGTLTLTQYSVIKYDSGINEPCPSAPLVANGGGIASIIESIHIGLSKSDKSGVKIIPDLIQESLKSSSAKSVEYLYGNKPKNIYKSVNSALGDWVEENPQVKRILTYSLAALLRKEAVFLTGGGFASEVVHEWVSSYLLKNVPNATLERLENSHEINVTGLAGLPSLVPAKRARKPKKAQQEPEI
jgi:hypothetical protein